MRKYYYCALIFLLLPFCSIAQEPTDTPSMAASPPEDRTELRVNLNESGTHHFRITFLNQTWLRYTQHNPGTLVLGEPANHTFDIGLRRTRIQMFGQLTDRALVYFQFGQNNFNYLAQSFLGDGIGNRKLQAFFHDAFGEYIVFRQRNYLKIGAGLTIVNGLSRFNQASVVTSLTTDVPIFAQATVDQIDQFSRKLSLYARGQIGRIDYRLIFSDPFPPTTAGIAVPPLSANATYAQVGQRKQYHGLVFYRFLDREPHELPISAGTYLGNRKIFNLEAGFVSQRRAMWYRNGSDTAFANLRLWSAAAFLDMPVNPGTGTAVSAYAGYFSYDFGPNYLRYVGIMNPANGTTAPLPGVTGSTFGNAFPMMGTGNIVYLQFGYLLPKNLLGEGNGKLLPYAAFTYADYQRLNNPAAVYNVGVNWLIRSHFTKISLDYQNRPVYEAGTAGELTTNGRRAMIVMQYQIFI